ncbi:MAG: OsmC family protein [Bryobacteraceae bacterium]
MMGTFAGALEARKIPAASPTLRAEAVGEVETEDNVLVIRRIHIRMLLKAEPSQRETAERVHEMFADKCPVYRSLKGSIAITSELVWEGTS